jgi:hypothetical protein
MGGDRLVDSSHYKDSNLIKHLLIGAAIAAALSVPVLSTRADVIADQGPPDLAPIFNSNYHYYQTVDFWNNVSCNAIDASAHVIDSQFGTYTRDEPNGITVGPTYLQPDAAHPQGQAFR